MTQFCQHTDANATRIAFPSNPPEAIRAMLTSAGFRWSSAGFWWRRGSQDAADFIAELERTLNRRPEDAPGRDTSGL